LFLNSFIGAFSFFKKETVGLGVYPERSRQASIFSKKKDFRYNPLRAITIKGNTFFYLAYPENNNQTQVFNYFVLLELLHYQISL